MRNICIGDYEISIDYHTPSKASNRNRDTTTGPSNPLVCAYISFEISHSNTLIAVALYNIQKKREFEMQLEYVLLTFFLREFYPSIDLVGEQVFENRMNHPSF